MLPETKLFRREQKAFYGNFLFKKNLKCYFRILKYLYFVISYTIPGNRYTENILIVKISHKMLQL